MTAARLVLEDGAVFPGESFGAAVSSAGEVVFNTAMTGYTESLTDPSYAGQILAMTWPLVGNYGVPPHLLENGIQKFFESNQIWVKGLVVSEYSQQYSHWNAVESLSEWMEREGVPGIFGIDTRALTKRLRERGTMLGKIIVDDPAGNPQDVEFYDPGKVNLIAQCSCTEITEYKAVGSRQEAVVDLELGTSIDNSSRNSQLATRNSEVRIALIDCGAKNNILRSLLRRGATVIRVPWNFDVTTIDYDGLMISNGPGDPQMAEETVENIKKAFELNKPIFGICMGNQLLARAAGATTYRMRYGHRGHNQPVILQGTHQTWITSQNHGYAVDPLRLSDDWEPSYINLNDGTCEGIAHKSKPFSSVQFHPEASGGPRDAGVLFDRFLQLVNNN
ncbi:MAG: glutamine-hydrolyzing carbamoyl-phosphate synthase small subunit [Thermoguttaceae bacterium]|nr:glutamine-hydrolyzing carbamoyl-phosphate synthase small subunit [Thermoguttaceae bacterium]